MFVGVQDKTSHGSLPNYTRMFGEKMQFTSRLPCILVILIVMMVKALEVASLHRSFYSRTETLDIRLVILLFTMIHTAAKQIRSLDLYYFDSC